MKKQVVSTVPADGARTTFIALMTVFGASQQLIKDRMRPAQLDGLGPLHLRLLCLCEEQSGGTQQQMAKLMGRDKGQVAHLLHALESRGFLARTPDAQDRRILRLNVTDAGSVEVQRFKAVETELARHLFGELAPEEVEQLRALASRLLERAATTPGSP